MASELYVETLKGLTSGANANKVIIPAGQTLDASAGGFTTPAGHIIQVVEASTYTATTTSGSAFVDSNIEATITPSSTNSRILISATTTTGKSADNIYLAFQFTRNGTSLGYLADLVQYTNDSTFLATQASFQQIDSPSSTSALTYKLQFSNQSASGTAYVQIDAGSGSERGRGQIILMEIAG